MSKTQNVVVGVAARVKTEARESIVTPLERMAVALTGTTSEEMERDILIRDETGKADRA